jgi:hypothetical protein
MLVTIYQTREPHTAEDKSIMATAVINSCHTNVIFIGGGASGWAHLFLFWGFRLFNKPESLSFNLTLVLKI